MMEDFGRTKKQMQSENNMARQGSDDISTTKSPSVERDDRLKLIKERQNEERQRKLEELKAQTLEAQKYREQKEEERKRRMEDLRSKELDKKLQVDERKKAIMIAERERIEFIMQKNQERDSRLENKKRSNRSSISFAFGSSTPRLLDPVDSGAISPSSFWAHRRSTSITNVDFSGAQVTRRSSEREFADAPKKRATSAGGLNRQNEDESSTAVDAPAPVPYRSVARRKTDLMPTIPSPRDSYFGSRSSLCHTPRTPGKTPSESSPTARRAVSMTRLDQLAQPTRRNGEHIRSVIEKQRQMNDMAIMSNSFSAQSSSSNITAAAAANSASNTRSMSRSTTHLADNNSSTPNTAKKLSSASSPMNSSIERSKLSKTYAPANNNSLTGSRSGDVTPGSIRTGDVTPGSSRPGSAMNSSMSMSGVVHRRPVTTPRRPRPASIACTGIKVESTDIPKDAKRDKPPIHNKTPSSTRKSLNVSGSSLVKHHSTKQSDTPKSEKTDKPEKPDHKPEKPEKRISSAKKIANNTKTTKDEMETSVVDVKKPIDEKSINTTDGAPESEINVKTDDHQKPVAITAESEVKTEDVDTILEVSESMEINKSMEINQSVEINKSMDVNKLVEVNKPVEMNKPVEINKSVLNNIEKFIDIADAQDNVDMTASMIAKRITTEEEAKAALAERRRLAREEAERQAEIEKMRIEKEKLAEQERIADEERRQKFLEEESLRLAEEQRKGEEQRLLQAIEEAKQREEVERTRREEEERQKREKEENERKAREEAEKQKTEVAERLKREEKEREERRKRVESIMSRTRAKSGNTPNKTTNGKDANEDEKKVSPSNSDISLAKNDESSIPPTEATNQKTSTTTNNAGGILDYETTVTEKENSLINSFVNLMENNKNIDETTTFKVNGKVNFENNHSEGHSVDNKIDSSVGGIYSFIEIDNKAQDSLTDQLINMNIDLNETTDTVNFNNNSLLTNATLVTPDSHDNNKEISLL